MLIAMLTRETGETRGRGRETVIEAEIEAEIEDRGRGGGREEVVLQRYIGNVFI